MPLSGVRVVSVKRHDPNLENHLRDEAAGSNYSHKEYFLVAASERALALARLRLQRPDLIKSRFTVSGEADPEYTAWLSMRDGDVLSVMGGT